jgi:hypothetical protein
MSSARIAFRPLDETPPPEQATEVMTKHPAMRTAHVRRLFTRFLSAILWSFIEMKHIGRKKPENRK